MIALCESSRSISSPLILKVYVLEQNATDPQKTALGGIFLFEDVKQLQEVQ